MIASLAVGAIASPLAGRAQPSAAWARIGIVEDTPLWGPFHAELRRLGYLPDRNVVMKYGSTTDRPIGVDAATRSLMESGVDILVAYGTPASQAAKRETSTVPIVAIAVGDPVRSG